VTNYIKVRKVIVYYPTPCFSLSRWDSKQGQSLFQVHRQQQSQHSNQQYLQ